MRLAMAALWDRQEKMVKIESQKTPPTTDLTVSLSVTSVELCFLCVVVVVKNQRFELAIIIIIMLHNPLLYSLRRVKFAALYKQVATNERERGGG